MTQSSDLSSRHAPTPPSKDFGRAAAAILATMLFLIVALTGILVETTWHSSAGEVEVLTPEPGSFARR